MRQAADRCATRECFVQRHRRSPMFDAYGRRRRRRGRENNIHTTFRQPTDKHLCPPFHSAHSIQQTSEHASHLFPIACIFAPHPARTQTCVFVRVRSCACNPTFNRPKPHTNTTHRATSSQSATLWKRDTTQELPPTSTNFGCCLRMMLNVGCCFLGKPAQ